MLHDIVIASDDARIGAGYAALGLPPEFGLSLLLPSTIGRQAAADLLLSGRMIDADEAHRIGLVSEVQPEANIEASALDRADRIARRPVAGLQWTKRLLRHAARHAWEDQLRAEYAAQLALFDNPETRAAISDAMSRLSDPPSPG